MPVLTAYGALSADWEAHHRADNYYLPGSAYDPDPTLPLNGGHVQDRYVEVFRFGGRVLFYTMYLRPSTGEQEALFFTAAETPPDATIVWQRDLQRCKQIQFQSATLAKVVGEQDRDGGVEVEFSTTANGGDFYSPNDVQNVSLVNMFHASPDDASGC